jgi:hypothetical protein
MSKVEHTIPQDNGAEHKIIAESFIDPINGRLVFFHVLTRPNPVSPWSYLSERPHPDWRSMSVAEYIKNGRSEALQAVGTGNLLKVLDMLEQLDGSVLIQEEQLHYQGRARMSQGQA